MEWHIYYIAQNKIAKTKHTNEEKKRTGVMKIITTHSLAVICVSVCVSFSHMPNEFSWQHDIVALELFYTLFIWFEKSSNNVSLERKMITRTYITD